MDTAIIAKFQKESTSNSKLALWALAISAFAIGTTEFVPVGLLAAVSGDLNISITLAGLLISGYAIGVAVGAPLLTALTNRISRKHLLMGLMLVFVGGNAMAATSPSFEWLVVARFITAFSHGLFFSIGSTIAVQLVPEDKKASAIALMFTGLTVAIVTGVPLGTFIGQTFGWRATFWVVALLGVIALVASAILVPKNLKQAPPATFRDMFKLITNSRLLLGYAITVFGYGGTFVAFTYLTPLLQEVTGVDSGSIGVVLLVYGVAVAFGNTIGGKFADRQPAKALLWMFVSQAGILVVMTFLLPFKIAGLFSVVLMGLLAFMNVPGLQLYVVQLAEKYVPSAVDVASALNIAAFNIGIALGATIGGLTVETLGIQHTPWIGGIMVLVAVLLTWISLKIENNE